MSAQISDKAKSMALTVVRQDLYIKSDMVEAMAHWIRCNRIGLTDEQLRSFSEQIDRCTELEIVFIEGEDAHLAARIKVTDYNLIEVSLPPGVSESLADLMAILEEAGTIHEVRLLIDNTQYYFDRDGKQPQVLTISEAAKRAMEELGRISQMHVAVDRHHPHPGVVLGLYEDLIGDLGKAMDYFEEHPEA